MSHIGDHFRKRDWSKIAYGNYSFQQIQENSKYSYLWSKITQRDININLLRLNDTYMRQ